MSVPPDRGETLPSPVHRENKRADTHGSPVPDSETRSSGTSCLSGTGETIPSQVGRYLVQTELGRGGMGVVYQAQDPVLDRTVALKVLSPTLSSDASFRERFLREARAMARIEHPNVVKVYDAGEDQGRPFFAMEYCEGESVDRILKKHGPVQIPEALDIVRQAARGLEAAQAANLIHRDIKPSNLIRDGTGRVKVLDFGLAKDSAQMAVTSTGIVMGTPDYMSPEQAMGKSPDYRSDIYALGATLYHILAGQPPHSDSSPLAILQKHIHSTPPPIGTVRPEVSLDLQRFVDLLMAKNPALRPQSYTQLLNELEGTALVAWSKFTPVLPEHGFFRFFSAVLLRPASVLSTDALLERRPRACLAFQWRVALFGAGLALLCPELFGYARPLATLVAFLVLFSVPVMVAAVDWSLAWILGGRRSYFRLLSAETLASPYLVFGCLDTFPVVGGLFNLLGFIALVRTRWAAVLAATGLSRVRSLVLTLVSTVIALLILQVPGIVPMAVLALSILSYRNGLAKPSQT